MVQGLKGKLYDECLRSLDLFSLERKRLSGDLMVVSTSLTRGREGADTHLFSVLTRDSTQENGLNLCQGRFRFNIRKRFLLLPCFNCLELDDGTKRVFMSKN